jgi:hypothetical protein
MPEPVEPVASEPVEDEAPEVAAPEPVAAPRSRKRKPEIPAWEDVLLGVRANGQR